MGEPEIVRFFVTTLGNDFMLDIADWFRRAVLAEGVAAEVACDRLPETSSRGLQVVIAPHEYFALFVVPEHGAAAAERVTRCCYLLNTERPDGPWFESALSYAGSSLGVFDISRQGTGEFRRRGIDAWHAPLPGTVAPERAPAPVADRPIDILFLGTSSPRRERFLATYARRLSRCESRIHLVDVAAPRLADTPGYLSGEARASLLSHTKILLNVHSAESGYLEAHRALLACAYGCAFVTESSEETAPFEPAVHVGMAPLPNLLDHCEDLLADPERLQGLADAGASLARNAACTRAAARAILARVDSGRPNEATLARAVETDRQAVLSRLHAARARRASGQAGDTIEDNDSHTSVSTVAVSVVITLFNYGRYLEQALRSVCESEAVPGGVEIVIVDDGSTDNSLDIARVLARACPVPVRIVAKEANTGLADARNVGLEACRGGNVLHLDADNWLYRGCLRILAETLALGHHAAVYPVLEQYDDALGRPVGLLSQFDWDVRKLIRRPYIDALAMFRTNDLRAVGGYSTELIEHGWFGWEDYDLWLKLADAGKAVTRVPQVLAVYRLHDESMIRRTNVTTPALRDHMRRKFARLAAAHSDLDECFGFPAEDPQATRSMPQTLDAARLRLGELQRRIDELHDSASWRVTAPLRAGYRWITGRP